MIRLEDSNACRDRVHCLTCRDSGRAGRAWRESLAKLFNLPGGEVNFDCPQGIPWNPTPEQLPEPTTPRRSDRCPHMTCANCSEPAHCRITGAEVDRGNCGDGANCEVKLEAEEASSREPGAGSQ